MQEDPMVTNGQFDPVSDDVAFENDSDLASELESKAALEDHSDAICSKTMNEFSVYEAFRLAAEKIRIRAHYNTRGLYDPEIDVSDSKVKPFVKITGPKVQAGIALLVPILLPPGKPCWSLDPSPKAHIPSVEFALKSKGLPPEQIQAEVDKVARKAADELSVDVWDSLCESGFAPKAYSMIRSATQYGTGIAHGPFVTKDKNGIKLDWQSLSWWSVYRDPWGKSVEDCNSIITRKVITKSELIKLKKDKVYSAEKIDKVLNAFPNGNWSPKWWEMLLNVADNGQAPYPTGGRYEVFTRWGYQTGNDIRECGFDADDDSLNEQVMAYAVCVGNETISVGVSDLHSDRLPFYFVPHFAVPDSLDGVGVPEAMFDSQDSVNACERGKINNLAFAVKPMMAVQTDRLDPRMKNLEIKPGMLWPTISSEVNRGDPIKEIQVNMHLAEIDGVQQVSKTFASEETGIPNFLQGMGGEGVHNRTEGGARLQFDNAVNSIKTVVFNYENFFIIPFIKKCADAFLKFDDSDRIRGDVRVIATGVQGMIAKENMANDVLQFAQIAASNPEWAKRVDPAAAFGAIVRGRGMTLNDIVLPDSVVQQRAVQQQALSDASAENVANANAQAQAKVKAETSPVDTVIDAMNRAPDGSLMQITLIRDALQMKGVLSPETAQAIEKQMQLLSFGNQVQAAQHGANFAAATNPQTYQPEPTGQQANAMAQPQPAAMPHPGVMPNV